MPIINFWLYYRKGKQAFFICIQKCHALKHVEEDNNKLVKYEQLRQDKENLEKCKAEAEGRFSLAWEVGEALLPCKKPSSMYAFFLREQLLMWKLMRIYRNLPLDFKGDNSSLRKLF